MIRIRPAIPISSIANRTTASNERQHVRERLGDRLLVFPSGIAPEEKDDTFRCVEQGGDDRDVDQKSGDAAAGDERQNRRRDDDKGGNEGFR
jgi:hypothetical protein